MASRVARLYRETLKRCRHLGGERGLGARLDAQHFYTQFRSATDATAVDALAAAAESRLGYLRMVTPKFSGGRRVGADDGSAARAGKRGSFVVRDGVLQVHLTLAPVSAPRPGPRREPLDTSPAAAARSHPRIAPCTQPRVDFSVGAKPISGFGGNNPDPDFVRPPAPAVTATATPRALRSSQPPADRCAHHRWRSTTT